MAALRITTSKFAQKVPQRIPQPGQLSMVRGTRTPKVRSSEFCYLWKSQKPADKVQGQIYLPLRTESQRNFGKTDRTCPITSKCVRVDERPDNGPTERRSGLERIRRRSLRRVSRKTRRPRDEDGPEDRGIKRGLARGPVGGRGPAERGVAKLRRGASRGPKGNALGGIRERGEDRRKKRAFGPGFGLR